MKGRYSPVTDDEGDDSHPGKSDDVRFVELDPEAMVRVKASILDEELSCPVCMCILDETYTVMECLHRFCRECISRSLRLGKRECPFCRTKVVSKRSLRPDYAFDGLIRMLHPDREAYEDSRLELAGKIATERALILGAPEKKKAGQAGSAPSPVSTSPAPQGREVVVNPIITGNPRKGPVSTKGPSPSKNNKVHRGPRPCPKTIRPASKPRAPSLSSDETESLNDSEKTETESEEDDTEEEGTLAEIQAKLRKQKNEKEKTAPKEKGEDKKSGNGKKKAKTKKDDPNVPKRGRGRPPLTLEERMRRHDAKAKLKAAEAVKRKRSDHIGMVPGQKVKLPPKSTEPELKKPLNSNKYVSPNPYHYYKSMSQYQHEILGRAAVKTDTEICARRGSKSQFVQMMNYYKRMLREQGKVFDDTMLGFELCSKKPSPIRPMLAKFNPKQSQNPKQGQNPKKRGATSPDREERAKKAKVPVEIVHGRSSEDAPGADNVSQDSVDEWKDGDDSYVSFALLPHPGAPTEEVLEKPYMRTRRMLRFGDLSDYLQQVLSSRASQKQYKSKYTIYALLEKEMRVMKGRDKVGDILEKDSKIQLLFYKNEHTCLSFTGLMTMNKVHDIKIKI